VGLREAVRLLVVWSLTDNRERVKAAYMYYCRNMSAVEIASRLRLPSKHMVRAWCQRLAEAVNGGTGVTARATALLARFLPRAYLYVLSIEPVVHRYAGYYYCSICGRAIGATVNHAIKHVVRQHPALVELYIEKVLGAYKHTETAESNGGSMKLIESRTSVGES
jgi:hypothetical protein